MKNKYTSALAKTIKENTLLDKDNGILFATNPGISFEALKGLAKRHNFTIGQTSSGEFVSIPASYKYTKADSDLFSLYDDFLDTYTYYDFNRNTLLAAYSTFDSMDENFGEITLILDTYVSEVLSLGFIENPLKITISNPNAQDLVQKVLYKNKIYDHLPGITRSLAKYGNIGFTLSYPYLNEWLSDKSNEFKKLDVLEDLVINQVNPKYFSVHTDEYHNVINYETEVEKRYVNVTSATHNRSTNLWQPWQFAHFKLYDSALEPYGKSMLWSMRSAFDQLTTLEALLGISRASKIQRLVFSVPLPNGINMVDAAGFLNEFRSNYLNSIFTDRASPKAGRKIPGAMSVLTLPESHDGKKVSVDHIESNIDLSSIEDVQYFLDKILRNSALPKGYLIGEDTITTAQTLEIQDLKLRRTLIPLKQALLTGMMTLVENILTHAGYDVSKLEVEVSLNEPIQINNETIEKYGSILELLSNFMALNPEMTNINKFQFLIKMGVPVDIARLVMSSNSINVLSNTEDLGIFLKGQKLKSKQAAMAQTEDMSMGESVSCSLNSNRFLNTNRTLSKQLKNFYTTMNSGDRVLKESLIKTQTTFKEKLDE